MGESQSEQLGEDKWSPKDQTSCVDYWSVAFSTASAIFLTMAERKIESGQGKRSPKSQR
jgi:hypothetical protein